MSDLIEVELARIILQSKGEQQYIHLRVKGSQRSYRKACGRFAFCGTFPWVTPAGRYPAPRLRGARTFLPCGGNAPQRRPSGRLVSEM